MLYRFAVSNFKTFKEKIIFDLSNTKNYEFNPECIQNGIVNKSIIYGYNGVGKSNLGLAIMDIIIHLTDKNRERDLYDNYTNANNVKDIAEFEYIFQFGNDFVKYQYGKKDIDDIVYEHLLINDEAIVCHDRREPEPPLINLPGTENLNRDITQMKISLLKYIKSNTVLPETRETNLFNALFIFVNNMLLFWQLDNRGYIGYEVGVTGITKDIIEHGNFDNFKEFLKEAGIDSNIICQKRGTGEYSFFYKYDNREVDFWAVCSTGTKSLILFYYWLQRILFSTAKPSFVYIDEFDAFYHQGLSEFLVNELKKNSCQVVLTTHNTGLMTNDLLRPDCYFLMYKDKINSLASLTDKELRFGHNIEKMYRAGAFDG